MTTDRASAAKVLEDWIPALKRAMRKAIENGSAVWLRNPTEQILEPLTRVPLLAESDAAIEGEELALLVSIYRRGGRSAKAFRRCGEAALKTREAFQSFEPKTGEIQSYRAVLELAEEMQRLVDILVVPRGSQGNVTHISAGSLDPQVAGVVELIRGWIQDFSAVMVTLMEAYDYTWADRALGGGQLSRFTQQIKLIASVTYLARGSAEVPDEVAPLVHAYVRGGKTAKAIGRCSGPAAETLKGAQRLHRDFPTARVETDAGLQKLIQALERLVLAVS